MRQRWILLRLSNPAYTELVATAQAGFLLISICRSAMDWLSVPQPPTCIVYRC